MDEINRQAVIIIHGMGEQRPMDTLRGFVDGIKWQMEQDDPTEVGVNIRSKPDSVGDIYETVRLSMESNYKSNRPITDFYEFYWAHNMRGTNFSQMAIWLKQLVFVSISKVPKHLKRIWWTVWGIFFAACLFTFMLTFFFNIDASRKLLVAFFGGTVVSILWTSVASLIKSSFLNSLGDVARYMTPEPDNIQERSNIRQQGITFLKKMHSITNLTKPDRIIVVAHSLGSVVAYDLIRLLWTEYNKVYTTAPTNGQPMLNEVNAFSVNPATIDSDYEKFASAQYNYWKESRALGNPWLITDFITLGAALNSLDYFMVNNVPFEKLIEQREIPVCPPEIDKDDGKIYYREFIEQPGKTRRKGVNVTHHGALFAMIRWKNIYYSSDFVGGPMQRRFGKGVFDIKINRNSFWFYPGGHNRYWRVRKDNGALKEIVNAMRLN
jgi:hypothetical protein